MNAEAVLMSAYALATQERYDEAERMLQGCPEAASMVLGLDLLARIRYAQNRRDEARSIWQKILQIDPGNEGARQAIDVLDHPMEDRFDLRGKWIRVVSSAIALGVVISVIGRFCSNEATSLGENAPVVYVTNEVVRVVTNEVVKPVPQFVDRVVTNVVERPVPVVSIVTTQVERVIFVSNDVANVAFGVDESKAPVKTNEVPAGVSQSERIEVSVTGDPETVVPPVQKLVYNPEYTIRAGDQIGRLALRYGFRLADFKAVNPGVDLNSVRVGQRVRIPGFFDKESLPK